MAAYVAGDLCDEDRYAVRRHLDVCGDCRDHVGALLADVTTTEEVDLGSPSAELRERVLATIELTPQEPSPPRDAAQDVAQDPAQDAAQDVAQDPAQDTAQDAIPDAARDEMPDGDLPRD